MRLGCPCFYKKLILKHELVQRTICKLLRRHVGNILRKDDSKTTRLAHQHNRTIPYPNTDHERVQVPVDVAMEEPRARVVREEPDCDIITEVADVHDVAEDGIVIVVRGVTTAAYNSERMSMQVNGMLLGERESSDLVRPCRQMPAQNTHRTADDTGWDGQFDTLVRRETVDAARGN
jgi:hypothetical protein